MESETELENFLLKTCRICLCTGGKLKPLIVTTNDVLDFLREVISIEPELGDSLPQTICEDCESNVKGCISFFDRCRNVDVYLRNLIIETRNNETTLVVEQPLLEEEHQQQQQQQQQQDEIKNDDLPTETEATIIKPEQACIATINNNSIIDLETTENIIEYHEQHEDEEEIEISTEYDVETQILVEPDCVKEEEEIDVKTEDTKTLFIKNLPTKTTTTIIKKETIDQQQNINKKKRNYRKPTLCQICGKILSGKVTFDNHMRTHDTVKRYKCDICDAKFWTRKNLLTHQQIHSGEKRYGCIVCGKMFRTYASCRYHQANHNRLKDQQQQQQQRFQCNICDKTYKNKYNLLKHEKCHQIQDDGNDNDNDQGKLSNNECYFKCDECGGNFKGKNAFTNHKKVHDNNNKDVNNELLLLKPFVCDVCGNKYRSKSNLYTHKQCHIMEQCPFCERTFSKTAFKTHLLTHTGGSNYECEICRKTYSQRFYLLKHMLRHKKNHFCNYCAETFVSKRALLDHQMNVCNGGGFQCEMCGISFEARAELVEHIDKEHIRKV